jgi:nucleoside-diphosphate-sugar epimerase
MMAPTVGRSLVVLYGIGGLSDVGRHAILAALENPLVQKITVITEYPEKLDEQNWECGCPGGHTNPFDEADNASRLDMVKIDTWKNPQENLAQHFQGADAVVSCLGHRQPGKKYKELIKKGLVAYDGNKQVIIAMEAAKVDRAVVLSSIAVNGDKSWPHWANKIMGFLFKTLNRKARKDLEAMEEAYLKTSLDYLFVRPVGIGEETVPVGKYFLQDPGNKKEVVGGDMAKIDVARFMLDQAVNPTFHRTSKTVGAKPGTTI